MKQNEHEQIDENETQESRRKFLKTAAKVAYVAPVILTLKVTPARADIGSCPQGAMCADPM